MAHARLSPSAAKRWMTCPGSVRLIESLNLPYTSSRFAAEGTVAHEVCERSLLEDKYPSDFLGQVIEVDGFKFKVTKEMVEACDVYVDYIRDYIQMADSQADCFVEMQIEVRCSLKSLKVPGMDGGTSDCLLINKEHETISVIDYKHGAGVAVEVHDNPQAMSYGLGALIELEVKPKSNWKVELTIVQPRAHHPSGGIRTEVYTADEIFKWGKNTLVPAGLQCHKDDAKLVPSDDGCRFCDAKANCSALAQKTQEIAMLDFEDLEDESSLPSVTGLTTEQKVKVMKHADMLRSFIVAIENQVKLEMDSGSQEYNDEFKLVRKTTRRKFIEEAFDEDFSPLLDHVEADELFTRKPKTLTEVEKLLKKKYGAKTTNEILEEVVIKPQGDIVVAPLTDRRKAVEASVVGDFNGLTDQ